MRVKGHTRKVKGKRVRVKGHNRKGKSRRKRQIRTDSKSKN